MIGLRLSEVYTAPQGEGPNVGRMSTFVRFAGCNMRCAGWPCDTPYAIYPDQYRDAVQLSHLEVYDKIREHSPSNVTITGGEPTMQDSRQLGLLVDKLYRTGYTIDLFTNGSLHEWDPNFMWVHSPRCTIILDWKLKGSGEGNKGLDVRNANRHRLGSKDALKFVVKDVADMREAFTLLEHKWSGPPIHQVYFSPAWGLIDPKELVDYIDKNQLYYVKLNVQVHKYIYDPDARGI